MIEKWADVKSSVEEQKGGRNSTVTSRYAFGSSAKSLLVLENV